MKVYLKVLRALCSARIANQYKQTRATATSHIPPRIIMKLLILITSITTGYAQKLDTHQGSDSTQLLTLDFHAETFFRNNEYDTGIGSDYTLPGYRLLTALDYTPQSRHAIRLKLGMSNIYYWGASLYPAGLFYSDLPYWSDEGMGYSRFRLRPFVQTSMNISSKWRVTLGSLESDTGHNMIPPLYNPELRLTSDFKNGVRLHFLGKRATLDTWVDWRSFIFRRAKHQEAFIFGLSATHKLLKQERQSLTLELQAIAAHRGGVENIVPDTVHTWSNIALGISYERYSLQWKWRSSCHAIRYIQTGGHYSSDNGWGLYTEHSLKFKSWSISTSGWLGKDYISVLGIPFVHAKNIHSLRSNQEIGRSAYLSAEVNYQLIEGSMYTLGASAQLWWHSATRSSISTSMELYLSIRPRWTLLSRTKR